MLREAHVLAQGELLCALSPFLLRPLRVMDSVFLPFLLLQSPQQYGVPHGHSRALPGKASCTGLLPSPISLAHYHLENQLLGFHLALGSAAGRTQPQAVPAKSAPQHIQGGALRPSSTCAGSRRLVGTGKHGPSVLGTEANLQDLAACLHCHLLFGWVKPLVLSAQVWWPEASSKDAGLLSSHLFVCFPEK